MTYMNSLRLALMMLLLSHQAAKDKMQDPNLNHDRGSPEHGRYVNDQSGAHDKHYSSGSQFANCAPMPGAAE